MKKNLIIISSLSILFACSSPTTENESTNSGINFESANTNTQKEPQTIEEFVEKIKTNTQMLEMAKEKAVTRGVSLEAMIQLDAEWLYNEKMKNTPENQIKLNIERIKADTAWMAAVIKQAAELKVTVEEAIKINAEYAYTEDQKKRK